MYGYELVSERPLTWVVSVNGKEMQFNVQEVKSSQRVLVFAIEEEVDIKDVLKEILIKHYTR
ncbi:hypothetical protein ABD86_18865 [Paenibacillus alvei]|nr:hypothetical protein [Paenibacillus alvei]MBG9745908.1 hypothetical protein [Paenibacillus alvei]